MTITIRLTGATPEPSERNGSLVLTRDHVAQDFESIPDWTDDGPSVCTVTEWSYSTPKVDGVVTVNCVRGIPERGVQPWAWKHEPHPTLHGATFDTRRAAIKAGFDAGVLGLFIAARNLPNFHLIEG